MGNYVSQILVGVVIAVVVYTANIQTLRYFEKKSLQSAFAGEIEAIIVLAETIELKEIINDSLEVWKKEKKEKLLNMPARGNYFNVYLKNVDKIGLLDKEISRHIAKFYTYCFSAVEYMNDLSDPRWVEMRDFDFKRDVDRLNELIDKIFKEGKFLTEELK